MRRISGHPYCDRASRFIFFNQPQGENIMMWTSKALLSIALVAPAVAFSQTSEPLSRAQVVDDLVRYEQAGYQPGMSADASFYPADLQAAATRVAADRTRTSAYGSTAGEQTSSGRPAASVGR
ncbi:DUF4148 domain-containing protein [Burkholderia ubonensis]|uniref:DUF4148 domain-containing protein n=1 Tax=Burkholderia ubonensis TaxID=101571 RepID=UPI001E32DFD6|nr:DUF4148 domain-containing protein [Burkholderia ubonensis]